VVSVGFSWQILTQRPLSDAGSKAWERPRLLEAIGRRPSFSFGFRNFLADIAWLEAVQVSGNMKLAPADYDRLYDLLNVVADFDPKFEIPYILGGLVLGESPVHSREALRVLERGMAHHPADWRFPFYIGFTHYFSLGDPEAAGRSMAEAARLPGSPAYLTGLASRMLSEARKPAAALSMLETITRQETDPSRRAVLERRIRDVTIERDLQMLEQAMERYREKTGGYPAKLEDLVREGVLPAIPAEPNGGNYLMMQGGKVRSDKVAQRLRVFRSQ
jgi:hypothetical protein